MLLGKYIHRQYNRPWRRTLALPDIYILLTLETILQMLNSKEYSEEPKQFNFVSKYL